MSNKRLKIGASFPGFYLTFLTPRLVRLSLLTPRLTLARASQQNTCLFHPTDGESHPSRLRASISSLVTASASRPPNFTFSVFTCPTASLNLPSDAGESTPARQPYLFHPTADLPFRLYLSDTASLDLPSDAGESTPARQPYLFNLLRNEAHPSDTAISKPVGRRQEPPRQQPHLFLLDEAYPSDTAISKPVGRQREPTGQSNLSFPFCGRQSLPNHAAGWPRGFPTT